MCTYRLGEKGTAHKHRLATVSSWWDVYFHRFRDKSKPGAINRHSNNLAVGVIYIQARTSKTCDYCLDITLFNSTTNQRIAVGDNALFLFKWKITIDRNIISIKTLYRSVSSASEPCIFSYFFFVLFCFFQFTNNSTGKSMLPYDHHLTITVFITCRVGRPWHSPIRKHLDLSFHVEVMCI